MHWEMLQIKHFTALQKMPHFQDLQTGPPQRDQKYYCESKETYLSYSLDDKAFHLPEFRAKLFFKGN